MPPIESRAPRTDRPAPRGRGTAWLASAVVLVAVACGSADESAGVSAEPTPLVDAVTGEVVEVPEDFGLRFDPVITDPEDPEAGGDAESDEAVGEEREGDGAAEPEQPAGDAVDPDRGDDRVHPLETVVIDTVEVDPEAAPVLDEAAALACANTEFAMDALIEASPDVGERFSTAAEWAAESGYEPVRSLADRLAAAPTGSAADELVLRVLETCAAAGYEL